MSREFYFDVDQLIADLGGVMKVSRALDVPRVYLWTWRKQGRLPSKRWVQIKNTWPHIKFDLYFKRGPRPLSETAQ